MKRRKALQLTASLLGGGILGSEIFLSGCKQTERKKTVFSEKDILLMDEIGETILPDSERSPGAKAAGIGKFMQTIVTDCYSEKDTAAFITGLKEVNAAAQKKYGAGFVKLSSQQRFDLLLDYDKAARQEESKTTPHFFTMLKQLTIWGYFTSEIGQTKALRYNPVPGRFNGNTDYKPGDRAWVGPLCSID
jgi:hypothetical protein